MSFRVTILAWLAVEIGSVMVPVIPCVERADRVSAKLERHKLQRHDTADGGNGQQRRYRTESLAERKPRAMARRSATYAGLSALMTV